jgi:hypothetical protein
MEVVSAPWSYVLFGRATAPVNAWAEHPAEKLIVISRAGLDIGACQIGHLIGKEELAWVRCAVRLLLTTGRVRGVGMRVGWMHSVT